MIKKILLSVVLTASVSSSVSYALPSDSWDIQQKWLKKHPFLNYQSLVGNRVNGLRKIKNNKKESFVSFTSSQTSPNKNGKQIIEDETIYLDNCQDEIDLDEFYSGNLKCIENTGFDITDNKNPELLKIVGLIYGKNSDILNDLKNAKLLKKGNRLFYSEYNPITDGRKVKLPFKIEERVYKGKLYYYFTSYYQIKILKRNSNLEYIANNWKDDILLLKKLGKETAFDLKK